MGTLVGMTIFAPLYFDSVLHLSASQSGLALIPLMGATVTFSTVSGQALARVRHYKRIPLTGLAVAILALLALAAWPDRMPLTPVLVLLTLVGCGLGSVFPVSTVCMQNAVSQAQMGVATGAANFFRALISALVVAVLGAIVMGGLGGATGASVERLAHAASAHELAHAFRYVFVACALVLVLSTAFMMAMEERVLRGPAAHRAAD
jgi:MFS family permease